MNTHDRQVIHSSAESDWRTPPALFAALYKEFSFQTDAAADAASALCASWYGPGSSFAADALSITWPVEWGPFFLNPPFSRTKARAWEGQDQSINPYRIENWARKCWEESQRGCTIVGLFPFAPQTEWYRQCVYGHHDDSSPKFVWNGHAAQQERRLPHRVSFLKPDGTESGNAGVNTAVIVWTPMTGAVGPWQPFSYYWSYR